MKICEAGRDSCGCDNWKKGIRTINGQYPDDNRDFDINAGAGVSITPATGGITVGLTAPLPGGMTFMGTVGTSGTIATLPNADVTNRGYCYVAISAGTTPDDTPKSYDIGDMLVSNGVEWIVIPSGDDPVAWSQITGTPTTLSGYGITDAVDIGSVQDITGNKTIKSIAPALITTKTNVSRSYVGFTGVGNITMNANDGQIAGINPYRSTPGGNAATLLDVVCHNASGTAKQIEIVNQDDGNAYVTAPVRTYNASNTNDIVTIGSLQASSDVVHTTGNESIAGNKNFTDAIYIASSLYALRSQRISNNSNRIFLENSNTTGDIRATLEMRANDDGTAYLIFRKWKISDGTLLGDTILASL